MGGLMKHTNGKLTRYLGIDVRLLTEFFHQGQFFRARFSMHSGQKASIGGYFGFLTSSYATAGQ